MRVMGLRNCILLHKLPPTIGNLCNWQFLDICNTCILELSHELRNIQMVSIINMEWCYLLPSKICRLNNLQMMKDVNAAGEWIERCSIKMINLWVLGISGLAASQLLVLCHLLEDDAMAGLKRLTCHKNFKARVHGGLLKIITAFIMCIQLPSVHQVVPWRFIY